MGDDRMNHSVIRCIRTSQRLQGCAGDIMLTARALYERNGVAATSLADIARAAKISRPSIYYYFPDKAAITEAVLDDYVEDIVESVSTWNELRAFGETPAELEKCVATFRRTLYDANGAPRAMIDVLEELGRRDEFATRAVLKSVECIQNFIVPEYTAYRSIDIDCVPEMFCSLLFGIAGLMKAYPGITDKCIAKVIEQTLHLDMKEMQPPPWPEQPSGY